MASIHELEVGITVDATSLKTELSGAESKIKDFGAHIATNLDNAQREFQVFGDKTKLVSDQMNILERSMKDLIVRGVSPASPEIQKLKSEYDKLKTAEQDLATHSGGLGAKFAQMRDIMQGPIEALRMAGEAAKVCLDAFVGMEKATVGLQFAVEKNGSMTAGANQRLLEYASALRDTTGISKEQIISYERMLVSAGHSEEMTKRLIKVAADFAAGSGKGFDEALMQLSKTLGGYAGELGETIPELKNFTQEQMRNGAAIDMLGKQYEGFAEKLGNTVGAKIDKLKDKLKEFESAIGENLAIIADNLDAFFSGDKLRQTSNLFEGLQRDIEKTGIASMAAKMMIAGSMEEAAARFRKLATDAGASVTDMAGFYAMAADKTDAVSLVMQKAFKADADALRARTTAVKSAAEAEANLAAEKEKAAKIANRDTRGLEIQKEIALAYADIAEKARVAALSGAAYDAEAAKRLVLDKAEKEAMDDLVYITDKAGKIIGGSTLAAIKKYREALGKPGGTEGLTPAVEGLSKSYSELMIDFGKTAGTVESATTIMGDGFRADEEALADLMAQMSEMPEQTRKINEITQTLVDLFNDLGTAAQNALVGGVNDLFRAMDEAGAANTNIWDAAAMSFENFMVKFIDQLPMLLMQAGLQLIGVGQYWIGLAMFAAAGGIALVDALTSSDAERAAYGGAAPAAAAAASMPAGTSAPRSAATTRTGEPAPQEDLTSHSGMAGPVVNIYGVQDTSPAILRREMEAGLRTAAFQGAW